MKSDLWRIHELYIQVLLIAYPAEFRSLSTPQNPHYAFAPPLSQPIRRPRLPPRKPQAEATLLTWNSVKLSTSPSLSPSAYRHHALHLDRPVAAAPRGRHQCRLVMGIFRRFGHCVLQAGRRCYCQVSFPRGGLEDCCAKLPSPQLPLFLAQLKWNLLLMQKPMHRFSDKEPAKPVTLGFADTLKVSLTTTDGSKSKRPHQAFLMVKEASGLEAPYPLTVKESGKAQVSIVSQRTDPNRLAQPS